MLEPDRKLNCLLINPVFDVAAYWKSKESCNLLGAKSVDIPLGLITAAALMPDMWNFKLVDLNARTLHEKDWDWSDIVCAGGMIRQKSGLLEIIKTAKLKSKPIIVGGPGPSSHPELFTEADTLVLGEGEVAIPLWLKSWQRGKPQGGGHRQGKPQQGEPQQGEPQRCAPQLGEVE